MIYSRHWLNQFVDISKLSDGELAERISFSIAEVESIKSPHLADIRIGIIKSIQKIPQSKKLHLAKVDIGQKSLLSIIFGDLFPIKIGDRLPIAVAPTTLPTGIKVEQKEICGYLSEGMIVSDQELGLALSEEGLSRFDSKAKAGTNIFDFLGFSSAFELAVSPNRGDLLSYRGLARDLAALLEKKFSDIDIPKLNFNEKYFTHDLELDVQSASVVSRYSLVKLSGVKNGRSPEWLQKSLLASGLRPINLVVDCTNYVMLEIGQPLHAFDFDKISGANVDRGHSQGSRQIIVRRAQAGETVETLDGLKRTLTPGSIVIADKKKVLAAAGIMGSRSAEITLNSTQIALESAVFDPILIRQTAKALGLSTEASYRFERGVDIENTVLALKRAAGLILQYGGGRITSPIIDYHSKNNRAKKIIFSLDRFTRHSGLKLNMSQVIKCLRKLRIQINPLGKSSFEAQPPSWRTDITVEPDLFEEVLRLYGYDKVGSSLPDGPLPEPKENVIFQVQNRIARLLSTLGWHEVINYSFYGKAESELCSSFEKEHIKMINPLGPETAYLRTSLLPGLIKSALTNLNLMDEIRFYEIGNIFHHHHHHFKEELQIGGIVISTGPDRAARQIVQAIAQISRLLRKPLTINQHSHNKANILLGAQIVGQIKSVDKLIKDKKHRSSAFFHLDFEKCLSYLLTNPRVSPINTLPTIKRDVTFSGDKQVLVGPVAAAIFSYSPLIRSVSLINTLFSENKKKFTLRVIYQSDTTTLQDPQINDLQQKITAKVAREYNLTIQ